MRRFLDRIYAGSLALAALAFVIIAILVFIQVVGRIIDRGMVLLGFAPLGIAVTSLAEIGGFLFVAAISLGMGATLRAAGHVRVTMLLRATGPRLGHASTIFVLVAAVGLAGFAAWNSGLQALDSWNYNSVSFGMIKIPLWLPQAAMTLGLAIFCLALLDELVTALRGRTPAFREAELTRDQTGATDGH